MTVALQLAPAAARQLRAALAAPRGAEASHMRAGSRPARARRGGAEDAGAAARRVLDLIVRAGGSVAPLDPGTTESPLSTFFSIEVPDATDAARLAARLLEEPGVEAAYAKPLDEAPPA